MKEVRTVCIPADAAVEGRTTTRRPNREYTEWQGESGVCLSQMDVERKNHLLDYLYIDYSGLASSQIMLLFATLLPKRGLLPRKSFNERSSLSFWLVLISFSFLYAGYF